MSNCYTDLPACHRTTAKSRNKGSLMCYLTFRPLHPAALFIAHISSVLTSSCSHCFLNALCLSATNQISPAACVFTLCIDAYSALQAGQEGTTCQIRRVPCQIWTQQQYIIGGPQAHMLCLKVTNSLEISADAVIVIRLIVVRYWESLRLTKLMLLK